MFRPNAKSALTLSVVLALPILAAGCRSESSCSAPPRCGQPYGACLNPTAPARGALPTGGFGTTEALPVSNQQAPVLPREARLSR